MKNNMRLAIISDIHANDVALDAVLKDIKKNNIDKLFCLGDLTTLGPSPFKVVETLLNLECTFILGNHDEFLFNKEAIEKYIKIPIAVQGIEWSKNKLSEKQINIIKRFQKNVLFKLSNKKNILFVHGSPRSNTENILSFTNPEDIDNMIDNINADIIVAGHTHIQMLRQHKGILIINPGSVGCPIKEYVSGKQPVILKFAEYAIIEICNDNINVILKRLSLDKNKLLEMAKNCDSPMQKLFIDIYSE